LNLYDEIRKFGFVNIAVIFAMFMKKLLASITLIIYFAVSCGVMISFHYCMDRFDSVNFYTVQAEECSKCGMHTSESNGCCKDDVKMVKIEDNHNSTSISFSLDKLSPPLIELSDFVALDFSSAVIEDSYSYHTPPLISLQDSYLQNCVFLI
jgi:hypothetical protein